jgi:hypothetical protein
MVKVVGLMKGGKGMKEKYSLRLPLSLEGGYGCYG